MRRVSALLVGLGLALIAVPAGAAHNSNNRFDLKPPDAAPGTPGVADGAGVSNYLFGQDRAQEQEVWNTEVSVSGLAPGSYTLWAEGAAGNWAVCNLIVDASGRAACSARRHPEPALAFARVRTGAVAPGTTTPSGRVVLEAAGSPADADHGVEDGEIERTKPRD